MTALTRRAALGSGGLLLAGLALPALLRAAPEPLTVELRSDPDGASVWFDPVGLFVEPGRPVRWVNRENVHTVTAYHPANGKRALRMPEAAEPWDSGYLVDPGAVFERRFEIPGVYDYFCIPHEAAGMVGRLVVGEPTGPGAEPFEYFRARDPAPDWTPVPEPGRAILPDPAEIVRKGAVPHPRS